MSGGFDMEFGFFEIMFVIIFIIVVGVFIAAAVAGISIWNKNNHSPRLTVSSVVVTKRAVVSYNPHPYEDRGAHRESSTVYYVTFQMESGDRTEFAVSRKEYGSLVKGDKGRLTFQGTRYLSFQRDSQG